MNKRSRRLLRLGVAVPVLALAATVTAAVAGPSEPRQLRLVATAKSMTLTHEKGEPVYLDLGTNVVAGRHPLEVRVKRGSYRDPVVATQRIGDSSRTLPGNLVTDFSGFQRFSHLTIKNARGKVVVNRDETFCPNGYSVRTRPDAPDRSPYPVGCPTHPFTLGSVWGIQAGWAVPTAGEGEGDPVELADGKYTATLTIGKPYRKLFGIPPSDATAVIKLTVKTDNDPDHDRSGRPHRHGAGSGDVPQPAAHRPTGKATVPDGPKPDLRSLPAFGIGIASPDEERANGLAPARDHLAFSATVWTAGGSPLVVDGFRRGGKDVMDAYQYFYDENGKQIGHAPVGTMEWDARDGHEHWHFTDFAQYRLLDADKKVAVRSGKEAFCLANTDAVDYTLPGANWNPEGTDLHTACGGRTALAVRQVLDLGSGDTYSQDLPGQSFDITGLKNGTYYVEVSANPDGKLYEESTENNVSYRKVILGGRPGARTVKVPAHEGISG